MTRAGDFVFSYLEEFLKLLRGDENKMHDSEY